MRWGAGHSLQRSIVQVTSIVPVTSFFSCFISATPRGLLLFSKLVWRPKEWSRTKADTRELGNSPEPSRAGAGAPRYPSEKQAELVGDRPLRHVQAGGRVSRRPVLRRAGPADPAPCGAFLGLGMCHPPFLLCGSCPERSRRSQFLLLVSWLTGLE